jgi:ABC-type sugar transport system substrate-binding protein
VVVTSSAGVAPGSADVAKAELRQLLPRVVVRSATLAAGTLGANPAAEFAGAGGVLATDERAAAAAIAAVAKGSLRARCVAVGATGNEIAALRHGDVAALVVPQPAELGARAVHLAVVARPLNPRLVPRSVRLDPMDITRANLDTAAVRRETYP